MARIKPVSHDDRLTLIEHLDELRTRIIISVLAFAVGFGLCFWQDDQIFDVLNSPLPEGLVPGLGNNVGGGITVGLKPGLINTVPVSKKEFKGDKPWIMVDGFRIKIDGCVGESFIRSYAFLTRSTDMSDAVAAWYGVTKKV